VVDRVNVLPADAPPGARDEVRTELDAAAGNLDTVLVNAANLNAEVGTVAVHTLQQVQRRLLPGAVAFEIASALAAAVAIGAAYQVSRRAREAAQAHRLVLEQKAAELEAFSGRVAHDLLSPLMTVSMAIGLTEQRLAAPEDARLRTVLGRAGSSLTRVRLLVSDLLDFARAGATPARDVSVAVAPLLGDLIADLEPVAAEAGIELRLASSSARSVRCAAGILASVLSNLVQDAIRYAGGGPASRTRGRGFASRLRRASSSPTCAGPTRAPASVWAWRRSSASPSPTAATSACAPNRATARSSGSPSPRCPARRRAGPRVFATSGCSTHRRATARRRSRPASRPHAPEEGAEFAGSDARRSSDASAPSAREIAP